MYTALPILIKLSILALYLRTFSTHRRFRLTIYGLIVFLLAMFLAFILRHFFICRPFQTQWRLELLRESATCGNLDLATYVESVLNAVTDLVIMCLPVPILWSLQLPTRKKIGVLVTFATGSL